MTPPPDKIRAEFFAWVDDQGCDTDGAWSAWQAAYEAGRLAGMEEAAVICDELPTTHTDVDDLAEELIQMDCAAAIRSAIERA